MEVKAVMRYARLSPRKARDLARAIQGLPVSDALKITDLTCRKAAVLMGKTLRSAIANASNRSDSASAEDLIVKEAIVGEGPALRRHWPRARGMVSRIRRRTSHIHITLTDGQDNG